MKSIIGVAVVIDMFHSEWMELVLQPNLFQLSPFDEVEQRTVLRNIESLMKTLKLTAQQAMDALLIPDKDKPKYLTKL